MRRHRRLLPLLALALALVAAGCGSTAAPPASAPTAAPPTAAAPQPTAAPEPGPAARTITDAAGRSVTVAGEPQGIVTLAPSATEILFALDLGDRLLAVDDFSDYPPEAKALPKIGGMNGTYNFEQIVALKPDLVLASGITAPEAIAKLEELNLTVVVVGTADTTFESVQNDIELIGEITGRADQAEALTAAMRQKIEALRLIVAKAESRPRVYWELDSTDPSKPYTVGPGNFVHELIVEAGGTNIFADASSPFPQVSAEQIVAANPEVIVLASAAYGTTIESVARRPGWQAIVAVEQGRIEPIDDNLVSRPGPRIVDGLEAAARIIHPELFR